MVVEYLLYEVKEGDLPLFMDAEQLWTDFLSGYSGFINKDIWVDREDPTKVAIIIKWASMIQWKSIPQSMVDDVEERCKEICGGKTFKLLESKQYDYQNALAGFM